MDISIHASEDPDATRHPWQSREYLLFQSTHPKIRMRPQFDSLGKIKVYISIHASEDPDATVLSRSGNHQYRHFNPRIRRSGCDLRSKGVKTILTNISIHASEDPDATDLVANVNADLAYFNPRIRRSGCDVIRKRLGQRRPNFNPRIRRSGCDGFDSTAAGWWLIISIHASEDPDATVTIDDSLLHPNPFQSTHPKIRMRQEEAQARYDKLLIFQSTHPKIRMRPEDSTYGYQVGLDISIHASEDPDATPSESSSNPKKPYFNPRIRRSGCDRKQWPGKATPKIYG